MRRPEIISGRENRWVKRFRAALADRPEADGGAIGIEGPRLVEEALRSQVPIEAILVSEIGRKHLANISSRLSSETRLFAMSDSLFARLAATETPQGIAALVRPPRASFDDLGAGGIGSAGAAPFIVVLAGLQDPGNVGTILRTAEALGATGVATCKSGNIGTAHVFSAKVVRASAGAVFRLPIAEAIPLPVLQTQFRVSGIRMIAATSSDGLTDAVVPWQADFSGPLAVFIGNEGAGLPRELEQSADVRVRIPLAQTRGGECDSVESLNAATAAAILLYEAARQRSALKNGAVPKP